MGKEDRVRGLPGAHPAKKVYILSLGCSRNLVDSEVLQGLFRKKGFVISESPDTADMAVVNTCGFIEEAKQESINMILRLAELKKSGKLKRLIVSGCLSQRYPSELEKEIKEIDGIFGTSDFTRIPDMAEALFCGEKIKEVSAVPSFLYDHSDERVFITPRHYAYLKIQEGCSNRCSYCIIPDLRGPLRSRSIDSVLEEAKKIRRKRNIKELILVAQDITAFGSDKKGSAGLPELLKKLSPLLSGRWIRLLYTHPARFSGDLINVIADSPNICRYIDLPVQHINDEILDKMERHVSSGEIRDLIGRLRDKMKDVVLRTSVIVGFPGETDRQFEELLDFLKRTRFERLGAFVYSPEEGTKAAGFKGHLPDEVKQERFDRVMRLQMDISSENNLKCLGRTLRVLIDENVPGEKDSYIGRSYMDAPEVDGNVFVKGKNMKIGDFVDVNITGTMEYDLTGNKCDLKD